MKLLISITLCTALAGCATSPYGAYSRTPSDPSQWRVVSVTPVPAGTAARVASTSPDGKPIEYSSNPAPFFTPPPVYEAPPLYGPIYPEAGYYWPPVQLSMGFMFGRHWGGRVSRGRLRR